MRESTSPHADVAMPAPHELNVGGEDWTLSNVADPARAQWRAELAGLGGRSPLVHFVDDPTTRIELSTTHPGGLARFIAGSPTLLSQLIREEAAFRTARIAADRITAIGSELASTRAIDAVQLGIGLAAWTHGGEDYCAPILLRPLAIRRRGRDFEVKLRGMPRLNAGLVRILGEQFGIRLDPSAFVALTEQDGSFKPNAVIDQLRALTGHLFDFEVEPRLVVSTFAEVAPQLLADAADLEHPILDAIAGNTTARWALEHGYEAPETSDADRRDPQADRLVLDADAEQEQVVAEIAAGNSVLVRTLPGTGGTQTVVNALGALVERNKRVLVVSPRRATTQSITQRLAEIGLGGIAVHPRHLRRDLVQSVSRNEKAEKPALGDVDDALARLRSVLLDYREALSRPDPELGVSVLDCVAELSRLALLPEPPATAARLPDRTVLALSSDRASVAATMVEAGRLGEFRFGPTDSPWYGAQFDHADEATAAHELAKRLHSESLPRLFEKADALLAQTRMRPYQSIDELGVQLHLLTDIRDTLDRFDPSVFDRSLTELIAATGPRRSAPQMKGATRRRLRKLAKEYVRPGMHVGDLSEALANVQRQRVLWQRFVAAGVVPEVPTGISEVQVAWQQIAADLASLDAPLGFSDDGRLVARPVHVVADLIARLAADSEVLDNILERTAITTRLRELELDELLADLAMRRVPDRALPAELEQAWWRSALDRLLAADRALLGAKTDVLERLEADFRLVDERHVAGQALSLAWQLAERWKVGLVDHPDEADTLKQLLRGSSLGSGKLHTLAPSLAKALAPVWICSPYEIDLIDDRIQFDTVIVMDAGATTIAENLGAIRRAAQLVAVGDPVTQTPTPFVTGLLPVAALAAGAPRAAADPETLEELHGRSVFAQLAGLLPERTLTRSYRVGGEDLAELVNRRFYGGRIDALPWAGAFLGHPSLAVDYVDGTGMPDPVTGSVESVQAEVDRVVERVIEHVSTRPRESLMVVTASARHAARVQQAIIDAAATRPPLAEFISDDRAESFTVTTIESSAAASRDRVILSLGFGRTPHGRVLSDFGALGQPGGERLLAVAMTRARRGLVIISCFRPGEIDTERLSHGSLVLAELLEEIEARSLALPIPDDSDPMLVDLSRRLARRGLRVELGHRGKLGLVAANGGTCIVVETDSVLDGRPLREALRLRPEVLRRLGWHYARVHAFELFRDPDGVADRIARLAGLTPPTRPVQSFEDAPVTDEIPVVTDAIITADGTSHA